MWCIWSQERVLVSVFMKQNKIFFWTYSTITVKLSSKSSDFVNFHGLINRVLYAVWFKWSIYCINKSAVYCTRLEKFIQTKMRRQLFEKDRKTSLYSVQPILKLNREGSRGRHSALWIGGPQSSLFGVINLGPATLARFASPYSPPQLLSHFRRGRKEEVPSTLPVPPPPRPPRLVKSKYIGCMYEPPKCMKDGHRTDLLCTIYIPISKGGWGFCNSLSDYSVQGWNCTV
jgi:hypothetical protein